MCCHWLIEGTLQLKVIAPYGGRDVGVACVGICDRVYGKVEVTEDRGDE